MILFYIMRRNLDYQTIMFCCTSSHAERVNLSLEFYLNLMYSYDSEIYYLTKELWEKDVELPSNFDVASQTSRANGDFTGWRRRYSRFEGSSIERARLLYVLRRGKGGRGERVIRERDGERERETEAEGVGVKALRDTTPVASTRLPKEPPFGNRASSSTGVNLSTVAPSRRSKLMKNEAWKRL